MMYLHKFLSGADINKLNTWKKEQSVKTENMPTGAIGGVYTYEFTPTGIGLVIKVRNNLTKDILDLSDYDSW